MKHIKPKRGLIMAHSRKKTVELNTASLASLPNVRTTAFNKLAEFQQDITDKTAAKTFKTTGFKLRIFSSSVVDQRIVPKGIALGYKTCTAGLNPAASDETVLNALVEFVAIMKHRAERAHRGRDSNTHSFYTSFWEVLDNETYEGKGEGKNIFPDHPPTAQAFDMLVNARLMQMREKYLFKNQSKITKLLDKLKIISTDKKYEEFRVKLNQDHKNLIAIKNMAISLQEEKSESPYYAEGLNLLQAILVRATTAFSRTNLTTYKSDFLNVLTAIAPGRPTAEDINKVNTFFDYHSELITSLTDRNRKLYMEAAANVLVTSLCIAGVGEMLIPTSVLNTGVLANNTLLQTTIQSTVPEIAEEVFDEKHHIKEHHFIAQPIVPIPRQRTRSEIYLDNVNLNKATHVVLVGGTITAGILTGGVGVAIVGGAGLLLYTVKFYRDYNKLKSIKKVEVNTKQQHEKQFCDFFQKIEKDTTYRQSMMLNDELFASIDERRRISDSLKNAADSTKVSTQTGVNVRQQP